MRVSEQALEDRLWHTLQHLSDFDDGLWDETVVRSLDRAPHTFVVDGTVWSVELLHPQSPERARRSPWPVLVVRPLPLAG
ncbi:YqcI/YcgG family protein [Knoellia sp. CPCC 206435]|uniref:YqcI/YcgG family protein n=1 Tax=Knoellia terrae TaxID=3404797 RepID=UPI003B4321FF